MTLCCRLKTHLQGLPVCRVSFTGETSSSWFVWVFYYYLEKKTTTNFLSSVQLEFLKLWYFLDLLFSHWTNSLRRETWCARPFLCRMTEYLPVFSVVKGVYYSQAELERQVCRINLSMKRCIGAKVLVLCMYFGSAVLISILYQHMLLL